MWSCLPPSSTTWSSATGADDPLDDATIPAAGLGQDLVDLSNLLTGPIALIYLIYKLDFEDMWLKELHKKSHVDGSGYQEVYKTSPISKWDD